MIEELTISETLDVLDAQVALSLEPSVVEVTEDGLLFGFASEISGPVADCVDISSAVLPAKNGLLSMAMSLVPALATMQGYFYPVISWSS